MHAWYGGAWQLLADATSDPMNLGILAQYGLLGFVAAGAIIFGRVSYKREITRADRLEVEVTRLNNLLVDQKRDTDRADRAEAEVTRLNNLIVDRAIPALTVAAQAAESANRLLRDIQRSQGSLRAPATRRTRSGGEDG